MKLERYTTTIIKPRNAPNLLDPNAINNATIATDAIQQAATMGAEYSLRETQAKEAVWTNDALITAKKEKIRLLDEQRNDPNANPDGFADRFNTDLSKFDEETAKRAPTEQAKQAFLTQAAGDNLNYFQSNTSWQRQKSVEVLDQSIKKTSKDLYDIAYNNAVNGIPNDDLYNDADATVISAGSVYSQAQLEVLADGLYRSIQDAELKALTFTDPDAAYEATLTGAYGVGDLEFGDAVSHIFKAEGGYVEDDAGAGRTLYGVNETANKEEFKDIIAAYESGDEEKAKSLAAQVYKDKYWDAIDAETLDPMLRMAAFDAAVNQGVGATKQMLKEADGDMESFVQLRKERYIQTAQNPAKTEYLNGWLNRLKPYEAQARGNNLGSETVLEYREQARKNIQINQARAEAELEEGQAIQDSRLDLQLEQAATSNDVFNIAKQVDALEGLRGEEWANKYRIKLDKQNDAFLEKQGDLQLGAMFATGKIPVNPENKDHKKAANSFYDAFVQTEDFTNLSPDEQNVALTGLIRNTRYVPDNLKGEIANAARSQDEGEIQRVANIKSIIEKSAPYLLPQLGSTADMRRVDMINDRIRAGVPAGEAIRTVDERLDPTNAPTTDVVKAQMQDIIKKDKINFRNKATDSFRQFGDTIGGFFGGGLDDKSIVAQAQMDNAAVEYRVLWEDEFSKTRDTKQAERRAREGMALWGRTEVNGRDMMSKFPIENYYGIENQDISWVKKQAVDDILALQKDANYFTPIAKEDLAENIFIVPHPKITAETAATGKPRYAVLYLNPETGTPEDLLNGGVWHPDEQKERDALAKGKKKPRSAGVKLGTSFMRMD